MLFYNNALLIITFIQSLSRFNIHSRHLFKNSKFSKCCKQKKIKIFKIYRIFTTKLLLTTSSIFNVNLCDLCKFKCNCLIKVNYVTRYTKFTKLTEITKFLTLCCLLNWVENVYIFIISNN